MLNTKSIKSPISPEDGKRISIMSRHTLEDGTTTDPEISNNLYDEWWPELAPPPNLIGAYYKRGLVWSEFEDAYKEHLKTSETALKVSELIGLAKTGIVTVMCIEALPDECHRRLLAEQCLLIDPSLDVNIK